MVIVQYMLNFMTLLEYQAVRSALPTVAERSGTSVRSATPPHRGGGGGARYPTADEGDDIRSLRVGERSMKVTGL